MLWSLLKETGLPPGDATSEQMRQLADREGVQPDRVVVTHRQNLVFPDVEQRSLKDLWRALKNLGSPSRTQTVQAILSPVPVSTIANLCQCTLDRHRPMD